MRSCCGHQAGFTQIELLVTLALIATIGAITAPLLLEQMRASKEERAVNDLRLIAFDISLFEQANDELPASLAELGRHIPNDPWGNPYVYLDRTAPGWKGKRRKDQFIVPLNSDYDLFSAGPDGQWVPPLTGQSSRDDIVRASNGGFLGPAREF